MSVWEFSSTRSVGSTAPGLAVHGRVHREHVAVVGRVDQRPRRPRPADGTRTPRRARGRSVVAGRAGCRWARPRSRPRSHSRSTRSRIPSSSGSARAIVTTLMLSWPIAAITWSRPFRMFSGGERRRASGRSGHRGRRRPGRRGSGRRARCPPGCRRAAAARDQARDCGAVVVVRRLLRARLQVAGQGDPGASGTTPESSTATTTPAPGCGPARSAAPPPCRRPSPAAAGWPGRSRPGCRTGSGGDLGAVHLGVGVRRSAAATTMPGRTQPAPGTGRARRLTTAARRQVSGVAGSSAGTAGGHSAAPVESATPSGNSFSHESGTTGTSSAS